MDILLISGVFAVVYPKDTSQDPVFFYLAGWTLPWLIQGQGLSLQAEGSVALLASPRKNEASLGSEEDQFCAWNQSNLVDKTNKMNASHTHMSLIWVLLAPYVYKL